MGNLILPYEKRISLFSFVTFSLDIWKVEVTMCLLGLYPLSVQCKLLLKFKGIAQESLKNGFLSSPANTYYLKPVQPSLCKLMEYSSPFPLSLLEVSLEDKSCVSLANFRETTHRLEGAVRVTQLVMTETFLLSCWFDVKEIELYTETQWVIRSSVVWVCFKESQESQEINGWCKGAPTTLWLWLLLQLCYLPQTEARIFKSPLFQPTPKQEQLHAIRAVGSYAGTAPVRVRGVCGNSTMYVRMCGIGIMKPPKPEEWG